MKNLLSVLSLIGLVLLITLSITGNPYWFIGGFLMAPKTIHQLIQRIKKNKTADDMNK